MCTSSLAVFAEVRHVHHSADHLGDLATGGRWCCGSGLGGAAFLVRPLRTILEVMRAYIHIHINSELVIHQVLRQTLGV